MSGLSLVFFSRLAWMKGGLSLHFESKGRLDVTRRDQDVVVVVNVGSKEQLLEHGKKWKWFGRRLLPSNDPKRSSINRTTSNLTSRWSNDALQGNIFLAYTKDSIHVITEMVRLIRLHLLFIFFLVTFGDCPCVFVSWEGVKWPQCCVVGFGFIQMCDFCEWKNLSRWVCYILPVYHLAQYHIIYVIVCVCRWCLHHHLCTKKSHLLLPWQQRHLDFCPTFPLYTITHVLITC